VGRTSSPPYKAARSADRARFALLPENAHGDPSTARSFASPDVGHAANPLAPRADGHCRQRSGSCRIASARGSAAEVARRAAAVAATLEAAYPAEQLAVREFDVIETGHSKIAGRLAAESLSVETVEFGRQRLRLCDVRSLRSQSAPRGPAYIEPVPDPGSMSGFQNQIGKTFAFHVTGRAAGSVYGTGVYTADSQIAVAAVHTSTLKPNETAVLHVQMVAPPPSFTASTQNGITSNAWGSYSAAYRILGKGPEKP
jgi:hypothetical protein